MPGVEQGDLKFNKMEKSSYSKTLCEIFKSLWKNYKQGMWLLLAVALPSAVAIGYMWLIKLKLKMFKWGSSVILVILPRLSRYMCLVATILNNSYTKYFHHHRKIYWTRMDLLKDLEGARLEDFKERFGERGMFMDLGE